MAGLEALKGSTDRSRRARFVSLCCRARLPLSLAYSDCPPLRLRAASLHNAVQTASLRSTAIFVTDPRSTLARISRVVRPRGLGLECTATVLVLGPRKMPPSNYYRDRWPHPTPGNAQNPPMWIQTQVHPRQPPHRLASQRMDEHTTNSQVPPSDVRLRMGHYDPHGAEAEYGPYYSEEQVSYLVTVPGFQGHPGSAGRPNDEHQPRRDAVVVGRWIRPGASDDRVAAQLTGRIEMLRQRIGAVERREQEQRASWDQHEPQQNLPPAHQGVRWAYSAENRPGFWESGYGPQPVQRQPERLPVPPRVPSSSGFQPVVSSSLIRPNIPPPVAVPSPESDMPPPPVTGHKAVLLLRPNIALFSTDAMPVNCSPQPVASQPASDDIFDRDPQDITDLVYNAQASSSAEQRPEQVLYASYFLPPKSPATGVYPEKVTPERSADIAGGAHPSSNQPLPRTCECLTQTLSCHGCGAGIGYMIVTPCARCTAQQSVGGRPGQPQRAANGHRFVFHHAEIVARERLYVPGQPGVHRYPWGIPPTTSAQHSPAPVQQSDSRSRVPSVDSEPKSPSIPVFQPHRDGNFVPILSQVPARAPTRRIQNTGLKAGDVVFWHHLGRTGELGGVSLGDASYTRDFVER